MTLKDKTLEKKILSNTKLSQKFMDCLGYNQKTLLTKLQEASILFSKKESKGINTSSTFQLSQELMDCLGYSIAEVYNHNDLIPSISGEKKSKGDSAKLNSNLKKASDLYEAYLRKKLTDSKQTRFTRCEHIDECLSSSSYICNLAKEYIVFFIGYNF
jgi:hypothetical protein